MAIVLTPKQHLTGLYCWKTLFQQYKRWSKKSIWQDLFEHFTQDPDMQILMIDATIVRAHSSSAVKGGI
jgi:transposase